MRENQEDFTKCSQFFSTQHLTWLIIGVILQLEQRRGHKEIRKRVPNQSIFGENLFDDFDSWFSDPVEKRFFGKKNPLYGKHAKNLMKTDVRETKNSYEVDVDLPGFKKDEIKLELDNGYLTISAAKGLDKDETDKETSKYIRRERYAGNLSRSFYIGDVKQEDVKAAFKNGILSISVPKEDKKAKEEKKYITIGE